MHPQMDPKVKILWLTALRSGKFKQGRNFLKRVNAETKRCEHCCLGVLCEVYLEEHPRTGSKWINGRADSQGLQMRGYTFTNDKILPHVIKEWAGLLLSNPIVTFNQQSETSLANLNDDYLYDFDAIANVIENQL